MTRIAPLLVLLFGASLTVHCNAETRLTLTLSDSAIMLEGDVSDRPHAEALTRLAAERFPGRSLKSHLTPVAGGDELWKSITHDAISVLEATLAGRLVIEPHSLELVGIVTPDGGDQLQARIEELETAAGDEFSSNWTAHPIASASAIERSCARMFRALGENGIHFRFGTTDVSSSSLAVLDGYVEFAGDCPRTRILITGHTDSWGDEELNQAISEQRAQAVQNYLVDAGVAPDRLTATGKGSSEPIADNATLWGRSRNRRIEMTLEPWRPVSPLKTSGDRRNSGNGLLLASSRNSARPQVR